MFTSAIYLVCVCVRVCTRAYMCQVLCSARGHQREKKISVAEKATGRESCESKGRMINGKRALMDAMVHITYS